MKKYYYNLRDERGRFTKIGQNKCPYFCSEEFIHKLESFLNENQNGFTVITGKPNVFMDVWDAVYEFFQNESKLYKHSNNLLLGASSKEDYYQLGSFCGSMRTMGTLPKYKVFFLPLFQERMILFQKEKERTYNYPHRYKFLVNRAYRVIEIESVSQWNAIQIKDIKNKDGKLLTEVWRRKT